MFSTKGVEVDIEMIGLPQVMKQAVQSLAIMCRAVIAGISEKPLEVDTYRKLLSREAEIIGTNDHLLHELPLLLELTRGSLPSANLTRVFFSHRENIHPLVHRQAGSRPRQYLLLLLIQDAHLLHPCP